MHSIIFFRMAIGIFILQLVQAWYSTGNIFIRFYSSLLWSHCDLFNAEKKQRKMFLVELSECLFHL